MPVHVIDFPITITKYSITLPITSYVAILNYNYKLQLHHWQQTWDQIQSICILLYLNTLFKVLYLYFKILNPMYLYLYLKYTLT